jgi:hypothetical protein
MSKFSELLNKPLPSQKTGMFTEGACCNEDGDINPEITDDITITTPVPEENPVEADQVVPQPAVVDGEVDVTLTPEEDQHIDDTLNAVATPLLLQDELKSDEEIKEFVESVDSDIAIAEGFLTERTIIKFDKHARKAQLYEVAVAAVAREKKDPLYKKLQTVYKMERILKAKLRKKYDAPAKIKVKEYLARAKRSKSGILARIAAKILGK